MAKAKANKKVGLVGLELPECPVCFEVLSAPIYNCQSGHSLCGSCYSNLCPSICPTCRQPMMQMRNRALEEMISKATVSCPNKNDGCVYTLKSHEVEDHVKECIFREMPCPLGAVFGKCSWHGKAKDMMEHFKDRHPENCNISPDSDVELDNICLTDDERYVFLVTQGKLLFVLTVKVDFIQKMAYWVIQHIGSKKIAQQHVYEIHIISKQDNRRKAIFSECCLNEAVKADEIFRQGKCGIVPFSMLNQFIKDKKVLFKFFIKRIPSKPTQRFEKVEESGGPSRGVGGPKPRGPHPRGPRPHGPRHESRSLSQSGHRSPSPFVSGGARKQFENNHPFNFKD